MTAQRMCGDVAVLVPAAGSGVRLGPGIPKALRLLRGEPLLIHAIRRVAQAHSVGCVVVSAPPDEIASVTETIKSMDISTRVIVVRGGSTRQDSVAAALCAVPDSYPIVLVHDAARALTPSTLIERVATAVREGCDAVIPVLPVIDTIKCVDDAGVVVRTVTRSSLRVVQTPQGFRRGVLVKAYESAIGGHTDDAGLVEYMGISVSTVPGDELAMKITKPFDLVLAELLLEGSPL